MIKSDIYLCINTIKTGDTHGLTWDGVRNVLFKKSNTIRVRGRSVGKRYKLQSDTSVHYTYNIINGKVYNRKIIKIGSYD